MESTVKIYSLSHKDVKTYIFAGLFIIGNILFPQLCHLIPNGGHILLPIYFFTLIGAYKYGWRVGLLTALLSPFVNSLLFGMPAATALPIIMIKSSLLALSAAFIANRSQSISILWMFVVVLMYQIVGSGIESLIEGSFAAGFSDFTMGFPGMLIQIFGGYLFIKCFLQK